MIGPPAVAEIVEAVAKGASEILGAGLVGLYVRGSLATGDFEPERSDVDLLAVTERPLDDAAFAALAALHERLAASANPYGARLEIAYLPREAARRWRPGQRHPTLGQREQLVWTEHGSNWLFERWTVRECGCTVLGPDPRELFDPVPPEALREAARARLHDWGGFARERDDPAWRFPLSEQAYYVETICRTLHTLEHAVLASKLDARAWALATLPDPWRGLVERSRAWRSDPGFDPAVAPEVQRFLLWAETAHGGDGR